MLVLTCSYWHKMSPNHPNIHFHWQEVPDYFQYQSYLSLLFMSAVISMSYSTVCVVAPILRAGHCFHKEGWNLPYELILRALCRQAHRTKFTMKPLIKYIVCISSHALFMSPWGQKGKAYVYKCKHKNYFSRRKKKVKSLCGSQTN